MGINSNIWQVGAGDTDRDYVQVCLNWDVVLNGPGRFGPWPEEVERLYKANWSSRKVSDHRRFSEDIKSGDYIVLRLGTKEVHGVGRVVGGYEHLQCFADVDGWDLQHVRRVVWLWKASKGEPEPFQTYTLKQGDTTQLLASEDDATYERGKLRNFIERCKADDGGSQEPRELPAKPYKIRPEGLTKLLFDYGVGASSMSSISAQVADLAQLASWYGRKELYPSEAETVSHLVVPLLTSLGWSPQRIELESTKIGSGKGRADLALYKGGDRNPANIQMIVEAKRFDASSAKGFEQAKAYADGVAECSRVVLTDGIRYAIHLRADDGDFGPYPNAYLNLADPLSHYDVLSNSDLYNPLHLDKNGQPGPQGGCCGADVALVMLSSDWHPGMMAMPTRKPVEDD